MWFCTELFTLYEVRPCWKSVQSEHESMSIPVPFPGCGDKDGSSWSLKGFRFVVRVLTWAGYDRFKVEVGFKLMYTAWCWLLCLSSECMAQTDDTSLSCAPPTRYILIIDLLLKFYFARYFLKHIMCLAFSYRTIILTGKVIILFMVRLEALKTKQKKTQKRCMCDYSTLTDVAGIHFGGKQWPAEIPTWVLHIARLSFSSSQLKAQWYNYVEGTVWHFGNYMRSMLHLIKWKPNHLHHSWANCKNNMD